MTAHPEVRLLRRHAMTVLACATLGAVSGAAYVRSVEPVYEATVVLFVSATQTPSGGGVYDRARFAQERVTSYVALVPSPPVLLPVLSVLDLPGTPAELAARLTVTAAPGTVLLRITAEADDPAEAALVANETATSFAGFVSQLEGADDGVPSVDLLVTQPAVVDAAPVRPRVRLDVGLGVFFGLLVGLVVAALRQRWTVDEREPAASEPDTGSDVPTVASHRPVKPTVAPTGRRGPREPGAVSVLGLTGEERA